VLAVLVVIVTIASRAHAPAGGGATHGVDSGFLWEFLLVGFAAFMLLWAPVALWVFLASRAGLPAGGRAPGRRLSPIRIAVALGVISALILLVSRIHSAYQQALKLLNVTGSDVGRAKHKAPLPFDWAPAVAILALAAVGGLLIAYFLLRTQRSSRGPTRAELAARLSAVLDESLDDLRHERDARRAVIAAYARMERTLAGAGLPREPAEAPLEYMGRVLRDLLRTSAAAVSRLTALFERAKFSRHEIDGSMKDEAIAALVAVRDELRAAAA
jgi:Domain of unknown function (DUF4129)